MTKKLYKIEAILFDLDGTLIPNSRAQHKQALEIALKTFGCETDTSSLDSLSTRQKLDFLGTQNSLVRINRQKIEQLKKDITQLVFENMEFYDDRIYEVIRHLSKNYLVGVCTNSIRPTLDLIVGKMRLTRLFDLTLSNEDIINPKPNPEMYEVAAHQLNLTPGQILVVEDSPVGIKAAKDAGCHVFEVKGPQDITIQSINNAIKVCNEPL